MSMGVAAVIQQTAEFVPGAHGGCFRMVSEPASGPLRGTVIAAHAFAEEMNKSRRMAARMARLLAGAGWRVVQRDFSGCGDSGGELADASWADWLAELRAELSRVPDGEPLWLWGVRCGALLVAELTRDRPDANLLLWQPVLSGKQHLQQFLRLHAGARIVGTAAVDGGPTPARSLRSGQTVEVGGYEISAALAAAMEQASFALPEGRGGRVCWFDLSAEGEAAPQAGLAVERLRGRGLTVELFALRGPAFWQTQEIEESEALLQQSCAALEPA